MGICVSNRDTECPCILHNIFTMTLKSLSLRSDYLGAFASGLCLIHCIATPFLFVAHAAVHHDHHHHHHHHGASPGWWGLIDSAFLIISLLAVYWTARNTSKQWVKIALAASWLLLAAIILNEKVGMVHLAEAWIYAPALSLIGLHLYNHRYGRCSDEAC